MLCFRTENFLETLRYRSSQPSHSDAAKNYLQRIVRYFDSSFMDSSMCFVDILLYKSPEQATSNPFVCLAQGLHLLISSPMNNIFCDLEYRMIITCVHCRKKATARDLGPEFSYKKVYTFFLKQIYLPLQRSFQSKRIRTERTYTYTSGILLQLTQFSS